MDRKFLLVKTTVGNHMIINKDHIASIVEVKAEFTKYCRLTLSNGNIFLVDYSLDHFYQFVNFLPNS